MALDQAVRAVVRAEEGTERAVREARELREQLAGKYAVLGFLATLGG